MCQDNIRAPSIKYSLFIAIIFEDYNVDLETRFSLLIN